MRIPYLSMAVFSPNSQLSLITSRDELSTLLYCYVFMVDEQDISPNRTARVDAGRP